ncbi:MAG: hypothetical protein ACRDJH_17020 [Thermomicrobiales bacterium]
MDEAGSLGKPELVDELIRFMTPAILDVLRRVDAEEFTTVQFIEVLQTDPDAKAAYEEALRRWGEDDRYAKMVIHGQVIPTVMRHSGLVEWAGYAYGEDDPYAVPAWWNVKRS